MGEGDKMAKGSKQQSSPVRVSEKGTPSVPAQAVITHASVRREIENLRAAKLVKTTVNTGKGL